MNRQGPDVEEAQAVEPTPTEPGKTAPPEGHWSDREIISQEEDRFSSQDYAEVLAERARKADTPLTIGIYGRWGSGKSSLMRLIEAALPEETEAGDRLRGIWINVWELSNQEEVWHAFLQALFNQVHGKLPLWRRIDKGKLLKQLFINVYRVVLVVTPMIVGVLAARPDTGWEDVLQLLTNPIAWAGTLVTAGLGWWALVKPVIEAARETVNFDLEAVLKYQPYEVQITELMRLRTQFEDMVKTWVGDQGRLVVFIDDLDRCTPDKVPEVLEAIKLFTTTPRCVYVLGLDHDVVRQGIETRYQFNPESKGATEYLEKIVQIPFHLPPLDQGRVESFVREYYPDLRQVCPTAPDVFSRGLEPNPRKVKRALNVYRTLLALAEVRVNVWEMDPVDPELVAKMVVIESRFRPLHQHLVKEPEFLGELDAALPQLEAGEALKQEQLVQALEKNRKVYQILVGKAATRSTRRSSPRRRWATRGRSGASLSSHEWRPPASTVDETDAKPGLVDQDSLGALAATLLAGNKRFKDQPLDQIRSYIYLIATTEGAAEGIRPSREERQALLGGDRDQIKAQVDEILSRGADEETQQGITQVYLDRLERVLEDPERYTEGERKSADKALTLLKRPVPEMVQVPAGEFLMGSDPDKDNDAYDGEQPQHTVHLPEYSIGKCPVTNAEYQVFVLDTGHQPPEGWDGEDYGEGREYHPVVYVTWHAAVAYCKWLSRETGKSYRLPSEAEWEKAARGTDGRIFPWGDDPPDESRCNFANNVGDTTPVGRYSPGGDSPYGCADMAGNVWEWKLSLWGKEVEKPDFKYPYEPEDGREDVEAGDDSQRVLRGGSFLNAQRIARCAYRVRNFPDYGDDYGFRVVLAPGL